MTINEAIDEIDSRETPEIHAHDGDVDPARAAAVDEIVAEREAKREERVN